MMGTGLSSLPPSVQLGKGAPWSLDPAGNDVLTEQGRKGLLEVEMVSRREGILEGRRLDSLYNEEGS